MRLYLCSLFLVLFCKVEFARSSNLIFNCRGSLSESALNAHPGLEIGMHYLLYFEDNEGRRKIVDATYEGFLPVFMGASRHRFRVIHDYKEGAKQFVLDYKNLNELKSVVPVNWRSGFERSRSYSMGEVAKNNKFQVTRVNDWLEVASDQGQNTKDFISRISEDASVIGESERALGFRPSTGVPLRILFTDKLASGSSFMVHSTPIQNIHEESPRYVFYLNPTAAAREKKNVGVYSHEYSHLFMENAYGPNSIINRNNFLSESVADFMAGHSISSPKVFFTFDSEVQVVRDLSKTEYFGRRVMMKSPLDHFNASTSSSVEYHQGSLAISHLFWKLRELQGVPWMNENFKKILDLIHSKEYMLDQIHGIKETKMRYPDQYLLIEFEYALGVLKGFIEKEAKMSSDQKTVFMREFDNVLDSFQLDRNQVNIFSSMLLPLRSP